MSKSTKEHEKNRKKKGYKFALSKETNRLIDHLALKHNYTRSRVIEESIVFYHLEDKYLEECTEEYNNFDWSFKKLYGQVEVTAEDLKLDEQQTAIFNKVNEIINAGNNVNKTGK